MNRLCDLLRARRARSSQEKDKHKRRLLRPERGASNLEGGKKNTAVSPGLLDSWTLSVYQRK